ncbi:MAG: glycosyltransferase family 4 protein [Nitrosarchaeum sp.]|nr:glycosyltransferase family 4 protein [Nitrosarchaeum sp.]
MRRRILYIHNSDFSSPAANKLQVARMCEAFVRQGVRCELLAAGRDVDFKKTYRVREKFSKILIRPGKFFLWRSLRLAIIGLNRKPGMIFTRDLFSAFVCGWFSSVPVVYELHDYVKPLHWRLLFKLVFSRVRAIVAISEMMRQDLIRDGYDAVKIVTLQDGVDLARYTALPSRVACRKKLGWGNEKVIAHVGTTDEHRDLQSLYYVSKKLKDLIFRVYGKESDFVRGLEGNNFRLEGFTMKPEIVCRAADLLFCGYRSSQPTLRHMSPLKLFEYMASGTPVVAVDTPSIREVANDSQVFYYRIDDEKDLLATIRRALTDEKESKARASRALRRVGRFSWDARAKEILRFMP